MKIAVLILTVLATGFAARAGEIAIRPNFDGVTEVTYATGLEEERVSFLITETKQIKTDQENIKDSVAVSQRALWLRSS